MGFFKELLSNNKNDVDLAEQLLNTQIIGENIDEKYFFQVNQILKACTPLDKKYPEKQKVLLKVIDLIGEPKTPKERYLVAKAYAWSRTQYKDQAIHYLELYLNNTLYDEAYKHIHHDYNSSLETEKNYHLNEMYGYLAKAYECKYEFDKCLQIYEYLISIFPEHPIAYIGKANILKKQNKLQDCYNWLTSLRKTKYYKVNYKTTISGTKIKDDWFKNTIDDLIRNTKGKIETGYIYKPRKANN